MKKGDKRGQLAIFVIVALVIVGGLVLFFMMRRAPDLTTQEALADPSGVIERCAQTAVGEAVDKMLPQGGFLEPKNYKLYNRTKMTYLCENPGYFAPCVNQHPMLINEMKSEIRGYVTPKISACFDSLKAELTKRQAAVEMGAMNVSVSMAPGRVFVKVDRKMSITQGDTKRAFDSFDVEVVNPIYDLANVAIGIADNEAKYCYFEYVGYMILYPNWDIRKFMLSDSTKLYFIKDKSSGKVMNIAIRGCAMPAGMGL